MHRKPRAFACLRDWVESRDSQNEAARELGISKGYLSQILSGARTPRFRTADKIARAANIPIESLLTARAA